MNKIFLLLILAITSCQKNYDLEDPYEVGEALFYAMVNEDSELLDSIFIDSLESNSLLDLEDTKALLSSSESFRLIKIDTPSFDVRRMLLVFFSADNEVCRVATGYNGEVNDKLGWCSLQNYTELCENYQGTPYSPINIDAKNLIWRGDDQTFRKGTVRLQNNTSDEIDYIKFRFVLKHDFEEFFAQTVEASKKIPRGDIVEIEIPGMSGYFAGFNIADKSTWSYTVEIIEARPKPEYWACEEVELLRSLE